MTSQGAQLQWPVVRDVEKHEEMVRELCVGFARLPFLSRGALWVAVGVHTLFPLKIASDPIVTLNICFAVHVYLALFTGLSVCSFVY